jgi:hypothetical protein
MQTMDVSLMKKTGSLRFTGIAFSDSFLGQRRRGSGEGNATVASLALVYGGGSGL